jgi:hypothetical protein
VTLIRASPSRETERLQGPRCVEHVVDAQAPGGRSLTVDPRCLRSFWSVPFPSKTARKYPPLHDLRQPAAPQFADEIRRWTYAIVVSLIELEKQWLLYMRNHVR